MSLSLETVRAIARLLHETDLSEIEIDTGSDVKGGTDATESEGPPTPDGSHMGSRVRLQLRRGYAPGLPLRAAVEASKPAEAQSASTLTSITASAVGVFFADCEIGAQVKKNQVLGRVEALKIPHEVRAQSAGKVVALLVEDGQGVEYGQELISFEAQEN